MPTDTYLVADELPICQFSSPVDDTDEVFWHRSSYHEDTEETISFHVTVDREMDEDALVYFDLAGDAEMHIDYHLETQSPITVPLGSREAWISVKLLRGTRFYTERELLIRIRRVTGGARMGRFNVYRAYLRSSLAAPHASHEAATGLSIESAGDPLDVIVELEDGNGVGEISSIKELKTWNGFNWNALSRESAQVPYTLSGTAVEGVDFTISPASPLLIPAGSNSAPITVTTLSPGSAKTVIITLAPANGLRRNLLSHSDIGPGMKNAPWLRDSNNYPCNPADTAYGKPSDWWFGCNNISYGEGIIKSESLRATTNGLAPDGETTAYKYSEWDGPGCGVHGCILKEFDGADVGASFDLVRDLATQAGRWACLSALVKEGDAEYFSIGIINRTVQQQSGTTAASHTMTMRWVSNEPTVYSTQNLDSPSFYGIRTTDPYHQAGAGGWKRIYIGYFIPADQDGYVLNTILRPSDALSGDASLELGSTFWGVQFEWGDTGSAATDVTDIQIVHGMHFWPHTRCAPGAILSRTITLLAP